MANPTTNYGFVLPTPTDLVTDLPADFEVALQGVDTQMKTNADAAIAKTIVDAKGDLIAATGADAVSRLAVGTNGQVLTADSTAATGVAWATAAAGGITEITSGTLGVASTTISSITGSYKNLLLVLNNIRDNTGENYQPRMRFNGDTGSNYRWTDIYRTGASVSQTYMLVGESTQQSASANGAISYIQIFNYSNTSMTKLSQTTSDVMLNTSSPNIFMGSWKNNSAITSITIFPSGGTNPMLGTYILYGVN
jgi:hypothetical protein